MIELLGFTATFLICAAYIPQLFHTIKTKNVEGLSTLMFLVLILSGILWVIYGALLHSVPLIVCNGINLIQSSIILYYKIKYKNQN